jgi:hypothetical protein
MPTGTLHSLTPEYETHVDFRSCVTGCSGMWHSSGQSLSWSERPCASKPNIPRKIHERPIKARCGSLKQEEQSEHIDSARRHRELIRCSTSPLYSDTSHQSRTISCPLNLSLACPIYGIRETEARRSGFVVMLSPCCFGHGCVALHYPFLTGQHLFHSRLLGYPKDFLIQLM